MFVTLTAQSTSILNLLHTTKPVEVGQQFSMLVFLPGQVPFINIHDLDKLSAELARLLGVSISQINPL